MAWQLVVGAISAGAALFNAVDEATANRTISRSLNDIKEYLSRLDAKIDLINANTVEILKRLDAMPDQIRQIVQDVVSLHELDKQWIKIDKVRQEILFLDRHRYYRINKPGWDYLSDALFYLFNRERRLSYMFQLINGCELALAATRGRAKPLIIEWLKEKIAMLVSLQTEALRLIELDLRALKDLLDCKQYIAQHNFDENLNDISNLKFDGVPDAYVRVAVGSHQECVPHRDPCRDTQVCTTVIDYGNVPDNAVNGARDNHVTDINRKVGKIKGALKEYAALIDLISKLNNYLSTVENTKLNHETEMVTLVYRTPKINLADVEKLTPTPSELRGLIDDYFAESSTDKEVYVKQEDDTRERKDTQFFFEDIKPMRDLTCL